MANIVAYTDFKGDINLPASILSGGSSVIDFYIAKYEKEALMNLLGYDLYKELKAEIDSLPQVYSAKWGALVNGSEFIVGGYTYKFDGLKAILPYIVYYHYLDDNITSYETIGAVLSNSENSRKTSVNDLMIAAWNKFARDYGNSNGSARNYIISNQANYQKWIYTHYPLNNTFGI